MIASEEEDVPSVSFSASGTSRKPKCVVRGVLGPAVGGSSCVMDVGGLCRRVLVDAKARDERTRAGDARLRSSFDRGLILNPAAFKVYAKRSHIAKFITLCKNQGPAAVFRADDLPEPAQALRRRQGAYLIVLILIVLLIYTACQMS